MGVQQKRKSILEKTLPNALDWDSKIEQKCRNRKDAKDPLHKVTVLDFLNLSSFN
jgi:hypothetical protein